jgi:hypothetical protein
MLLLSLKILLVVAAVMLSVVAMCFYAYDGSESDQW